MSTMDKHTREVVHAAKIGEVGPITGSTIAYVTSGGTYIIATHPSWTDSGQPRDLVAVTPLALEGTRVLPLYVAVNPDLVTALREELDS